jgi:hypothetical protein
VNSWRFFAKNSFRVLSVEITIFVFVFFCLLTTAWLKKPMISSGNAYSRLQTTMIEIDSPSAKKDFVWLPMYTKIMTIPIRIYGDSMGYSARLFTLLITVATAAFVWLITFNLTRKLSLSLVAASFYLINPLIVNLSVLTLSESIWVFFVALSMALLLSKSKKMWIFGAILWIASQAIRYESWYLVPLVVLVFGCWHKKIKEALYLLLSLLLFPLYWILETIAHTGNWMYLLDVKMYFAKAGPKYIYGNLKSSMWVWADKILAVFTVPMIFLYFGGIYKQIKLRLWLWSIPLFVILTLVLQVYFGTMETFTARYLIALPVMVYPLAMLTLKGLSVRKPLLASLVVLFLVVVDISSFYSRLAGIEEFPLQNAVSAGEYIEKNMAGKQFVYVNEKDVDTTRSESEVWYFSSVPTKRFFVAANNDLLKDVGRWNGFEIILEKGIDGKIDTSYERLVEERGRHYENENFVILKSNS